MRPITYEVYTCAGCVDFNDLLETRDEDSANNPLTIDNEDVVAEIQEIPPIKDTTASSVETNYSDITVETPGSGAYDTEDVTTVVEGMTLEVGDEGVEQGLEEIGLE